jgi:AraC family transcriptional regulator
MTMIPESLVTIAPGPAKLMLSSLPLHLNDVLVEKHSCSKGERLEMSINCHVITILVSRMAKGEHGNGRGHFLPYVKIQGAVTILPAGFVPTVRLANDAQFIHCAISPELMRTVSEKTERSAGDLLRFQSGLQDPAAASLFSLVSAEIQQSAPTGTLYMDSLIHALMVRVLHLNQTPVETIRDSALSPRILNRVLAKIEAHLAEDLSLDTLATESGYSRDHFLRGFRQAMGVTPHQYLLQQRLERVQESLRNTSLSLSEIACGCGFSSHSHLATAFRKAFGVSLSAYRRMV